MDTGTAPTTGQALYGQHAVVIGGSIAGLLAARVLGEYVAHITIVDRDTLPDRPDHRKGVPQSHHAHGLLGTGHALIAQLFPGIHEDLFADGATLVTNKVPLALVSPEGPLPLPPIPGPIMNFSRYLLEWHMREHVRRSGVQIITETEVTGLLTSPDQSHVTGVRLRKRGLNQPVTELAADLVIDASGRNSHAPEWLVAMGYEATPVESINSDLAYASA